MEPILEPETSEAGLERQTPSRRKGFLLAGLLALVLVLGGAAFLAGQYLNRGGPAGGGPLIGSGFSGPGTAGLAVGGQGARPVSRSIEIKPAEELPKTPPDVAGAFVRREDNSLFVGTGDLQIAYSSGQGSGAAEIDTSYNGPVVEVVVTGETLVYLDNSLSSLDEPPEGDVFQQKVTPGSIDEIGENSAITAWGRKVGDRLIAEVVVYSTPVFMSRPGS
jgi:hypothetical protein